MESAQAGGVLAATGLVAVSLVIGSFVGVVVRRLPEGGDVVFGRSSCASCHARLGARDLVPLLSWLALRGRCRRCGTRIGLFYPAVELAAVAVALSASAVFSGWLLWASCLFGWTLLALALIDRRTFILPDVLTLPLVPAGLLVAYLAFPAAFTDHVGGALGGFLLFTLIAFLYRRWRGREGLGRGDAKLLAAIGAWVGWTGLPGVVLLAALMALAVTLAIAIGARRRPAAAEPVPFGPYLAAACWLVWLLGPLFFG